MLSLSEAEKHILERTRGNFIGDWWCEQSEELQLPPQMPSGEEMTV